MLRHLDHLVFRPRRSSVRPVAVRPLTFAATVEPAEVLRDRASLAVDTRKDAFEVVAALVSCAVVRVALAAVASTCFSGGREQSEKCELVDLHIG
jgi:hypothetical protein